MPAPRLFLVMPDIKADDALACLRAACAAGDVASLVVPPGLAKAVTAPAQQLGVAVLVAGEARDCMQAGSDGLHVDAGEDIAGLRAALGKDRILGVDAGHSRHAAMEAAEAGADYIAFSQNGPSLGGEPVLKWWVEMMEIPAVAIDPAEAGSLDTLLPQKPDFIRPSDGMWTGPDEATRVIASLMRDLKGT